MLRACFANSRKSLLVLLTAGFLLAGLVVALRLIQEKQLETVRLFSAALIESIRDASTFHQSYLPHNTEAEIREYRLLMSDEFEIVYFDLIPPLSMDDYELGLRFSNGAWAYLDVFQDGERVTHAHISVYPSPTLRQ